MAKDKASDFRVTGVFRDLSKNSDLNLDVPTLLPRTPPQDDWYHWGSTSFPTYLRFDMPDESRTFESKLFDFVNRRGGELAEPGKRLTDFQTLRLLPNTRLHLELERQESGSRKATVVTLGIVGLLTLLIAVVKHVNLATARAGLRAREAAMRKMLGGS